MKKKKQPRPFVEPFVDYLDTGIFPATVLFSMGLTPLGLLLHLTETLGKNDYWTQGLAHGVENMDSTTAWYASSRTIDNTATGKKTHLFYIIIPDQFNFTDYDYTRLAHECLHICQYVLPDLLDRNEEKEAEAYLHSHLMKQALNLIRENTNTK